MENKIKEMETEDENILFEFYGVIYLQKKESSESLLKKIRQLNFWRSQLYSTFFKNTF